MNFGENLGWLTGTVLQKEVDRYYLIQVGTTLMLCMSPDVKEIYAWNHDFHDSRLLLENNS